MRLSSFPICFKEITKPHKFCPGCGHGIVLKELGFAVDELDIINDTLLGVDIGCSLLAWDFFNIATIQTHHGRTIPIVSGYKSAQNKKICIAYVGDGGAYAIGLQALITASLRNDPITIIVVNNTLYGMTGGQMAPTTLCNELTTTTPNGKICEGIKPILGPELLKNTSSEKAFIARATISRPLEVGEMIKKALLNQIVNNSFSFVEILSICPTNWKKDAKESFEFLEKYMEKYFTVGVINESKNS